MQKSSARALDNDSQKTLEQRVREAGLPAAHKKKTPWPFLVTDSPAATPESDTSQPALPA
jgi:hypothetical protein